MYTGIDRILLLVTFLEETCNLNRLHSLMVPFPIAVVELAISFCRKALWGSCIYEYIYIYDLCTHVITCISCKYMILHLFFGVHMKYHWCDFVHLEQTCWNLGPRYGPLVPGRWVDAGAALAARVKEEMDWARGMETEGLGAAMSNWAWRPWKGDNQNVVNSSLISRL